MEKQTYVCTEKKEDTVPTPMEGVESKLGNWKHPKEMDKELEGKFTGCMKGEQPCSPRWSHPFQNRGQGGQRSRASCCHFE